MRHQFKIIFTLFVFFFFAVYAEAGNRNIYIDSSAGGQGDGSNENPYDELSDVSWRAIQGWVDGSETVFINLKRGSVFHEQWTIGASGAKDRPITIQAYGSGGLPIIDGDTSRQFGIYASGKDYVKVKSIKFEDQRSSAGACVKLTHGANNWTLNDCYFTAPNSSGCEGIRLDPGGGGVNDLLYRWEHFL